MTLNYKYSLEKESHLMRELNCLDEIIYDNMSSHQEYPHLFKNEDSLFAPDHMNLYNDQQSYTEKERRQLMLIRDKFDNKANQKFSQYLDTLDFNQFLQNNNQMQKNQKNFTSKSCKRLDGSLQCTFKPSILKKSSQMVMNMQPSFQRLTMPVRNSMKKLPYKPAKKQMQKQFSKERMQRLSKPRTLHTQPSEIVQYRKPQTDKKYHIPRHSNYLDVATRNQLWQEQKQIKIQKLRKQQQENKLKKQNNTYAPKLTQYRGQKSANLSNFVKDGIASYFERLNMAKSKNYLGKQNNISYRKQNSSPYGSNNNSKTPPKEANKKLNQKIKYDDAVKQLHKKLMSLDI